MSVHRATAAWTPHGWLTDVAVEVHESGHIEAIRPGRSGDGAALDGLLVPGLINAHTHLELSWAAGRVPGGGGLAAWVSDQLALQRPESDDARAAARAAAGAAHRLGTAAVCDVSNGGDTASVLEDAGLQGIVQHEILGFSREALPARMALARASAQHTGRVGRRPSPHGVYSTPSELLLAAAGVRGDMPATIHVGEDPAEALFTTAGTGPLADLIDALGVAWRWWSPPGLTPVGYLEALGVLGPELLCVHGVHLTPADVQILARAGSPLCLCPRSNLHLGGVLPDVNALAEAGVPLALGTDSLASCPDLDVLAEVAEGIARVADLEPTWWLNLATAAGADALRLPLLGRLQPGARPGVLLLEGVRAPGDLTRVPARRWLVPP